MPNHPPAAPRGRSAVLSGDSVATDVQIPDCDGRRPLTGRELYQQHKALLEAGASWAFTVAWLLRETDLWMAIMARTLPTEAAMPRKTEDHAAYMAEYRARKPEIVARERLAQRARSNALQAIAKNHPGEYAKLLDKYRGEEGLPPIQPKKTRKDLPTQEAK